MGYLNSNNVELLAKLTPKGRVRLASGDNNLVTKFGLGDSDSNYLIPNTSFNDVPTISGELSTPSSNKKNNGGVNYKINSIIKLNPATTLKNVETQSIKIITESVKLGYKTINSSDITTNILDLNDTQNVLNNLFSSFSLPILNSEFTNFTGKTSSLGGYSDTSFSNLAKKKIAVLSINNEKYSEIIDGKTFSLNLTGSTNYQIYGTYQNTNKLKSVYDNSIIELSPNSTTFGNNITFLFSDDIKKPNNDQTKSWSTGHESSKPFNLNNKELFNYVSNNSTNVNVDEPIGLVYLDKGIVVITNETIVNELSNSTTSLNNMRFEDISYEVSQSITCIANRGEFTTSTNKTWGQGDTIRINEIGLYDETNTLIAIGKLTKTYLKPNDDLLVLNIKLNY